jgi:nucleoside-diphosphate-sugar epimerase
MQNFNKMFRNSILNDSIIRAPAGEGRVSFIDVRDVAQIVHQSFRLRDLMNKTFFLTGGDLLNFEEVAKLMSNRLGREIQYVHQIEDEARQNFRMWGMPKENAELFLALYRLIHNDQVSFMTSDVMLILEREPTTFKQYLEDYSDQWETAEQITT